MITSFSNERLSKLSGVDEIKKSRKGHVNIIGFRLEEHILCSSHCVLLMFIRGHRYMGLKKEMMTCLALINNPNRYPNLNLRR